MHIELDGTTLEIPTPSSLGELLDGVAPLIDPERTLTDVLVDGRPVDATDAVALAAWRLAGDEVVTLSTATPLDFARSRQAELAAHLQRIADQLTAAAAAFERGDATTANRLLAVGSRDLMLVLELDHRAGLLAAGGERCAGIVAVLERIGSRLTEAERAQRYPEVAALLADELVPALRASA